MASEHTYETSLHWSGSTGRGYRTYERNHTAGPVRLATEMSADPAFRGDPSRLNPEHLVVMAASSCQLLSFLAVAAVAGVDVLEYTDDAVAVMPEGELAMRITRITLCPRITVGPGPDLARVERLVHEGHESCYVANSLRSEVLVMPIITILTRPGLAGLPRPDAGVSSS